MSIRPYCPDDHDGVQRVVSAAFHPGNEATLVEEIRASEYYVADMELVAVVGDEVVGHVMVSGASIVDEAGTTFTDRDAVTARRRADSPTTRHRRCPRQGGQCDCRASLRTGDRARRQPDVLLAIRVRTIGDARDHPAVARLGAARGRSGVVPQRLRPQQSTPPGGRHVPTRLRRIRVMEIAPTSLFHFSEDPGIDRFIPHVPSTNPLQSPAVWSIDLDHAPLYWFPRDCPRVTAWPRDEVERRQFEASFTTTARRVHAIELAWLDRVRSADLWRYTFDPSPVPSLAGSKRTVGGRHRHRAGRGGSCGRSAPTTRRGIDRAARRPLTVATPRACTGWRLGLQHRQDGKRSASSMIVSSARAFPGGTPAASAHGDGPTPTNDCRRRVPRCSGR